MESPGCTNDRSGSPGLGMRHTPVLTVPITATDIYQTTNTAPNIVLQDLPGGAFEATTKVTLPATKGYQQAGLVIYGDDNNYLKLVYSGRSTAADGNKAANVIQFAKEVNAAATETNSANLGAAVSRQGGGNDLVTPVWWMP